MKPFPVRALRAWNDGRFAPHICAMPSGGGGTTSTNTIQNTSPWAGQQGYILGNSGGPTQAPGGNGTLIDSAGSPGIYPAAQALYTGYTPQYYPTETYAGITPQQQGVMSQLIGYGTGGGSPSLRAADSSITSTLSPGYTAQTSDTFGHGTNVLNNELSSSYLDPNNSPTYRTAISNALASALPGVSAGFVNGNRSDSGLATAAETSAATNATAGLAQNQYQANQGIQNQAATTASNNLLTQQGNQLKAGLIAPSIDTTQLTNLNAGLQTAGMDQTNQQNYINSAVARYNYGQMLPWNELSMYQNAIQGGGSPGASTSSQSQVPYFSNPTANVLGAGTAALGLASAGSQLAGYSGLALGGDSLLGALFGGSLFSDRRLKTDIDKVGESDSGFPLYLFRYKGESPMARHIGVMAQDVEKKRPEAVTHTPFGMMVDYEQALAA